MMLATRTRRRRAAIVKGATLATLAVLLFTPRMEIAGIEALTGPLPSAVAAPPSDLLAALR